MSEEVNMHEVHPAKLPAAKYEEVKARAQRILDMRGKPPYTPMSWQQSFEEAPYHRTTVSEDEALILSEFVTYWLPYLVEKKKEIPDVPMFSAPVKLSEEKWIPWNGGEDSPVLAGTVVQVRFRSGYVSGNERASNWTWQHRRAPDDIVAYRFVS